MNISDIASNISHSPQSVHLIYAFNSIGKTRLSVEYKKITSKKGIYYNAYSEDLFFWINDEDYIFYLHETNLNKYHSQLSEEDIRTIAKPYNLKFDFEFKTYKNIEKGIESIYFFKKDDDNKESIKISRGEEHIFVWCFFLALSKIDSFSEGLDEYIFIDDPISSLDEYNIFITATLIHRLIDENYTNKKIIITTHHIGLFSIIYNYLAKSPQQDKYKNKFSAKILSNRSGVLEFKNFNKDVFLYHLFLLKELNIAKDNNTLSAYHFVLLRQLLENIASFLGAGNFSYVLNNIGIVDENIISDIINSLSHKNIYYYETDIINTQSQKLIEDILDKINLTYKFKF